MADTNALSYAPVDAAARRRRTLRRAVRVPLLLLLVGAGIWLAPPIFRHYRLRAAERACMTYGAPKEQVVYEDFATDGAKLKAKDARYQTSASGGPPTHLVADAWRQYHQLLTGAPPASKGTVFLHKLVSKGGTERLVAIDLTVDQSMNPPWLTHARVWTVPPLPLWPWASGAKPTPQSANMMIYEPLHQGTNTVFAGQVDPNDPARFSIEFWNALNWLKMTGELADDGTVSLRMQAIAPPEAKPFDPPRSPAELQRRSTR
ncbi:MAG TPA: hypothetical protein VEA69_22130 [Tepidisphaeraceae bacterium]|nr:hypothetical protein [Tepidisphaeraceae bacterium]